MVSEYIKFLLIKIGLAVVSTNLYFFVIYSVRYGYGGGYIKIVFPCSICAVGDIEYLELPSSTFRK